MGQRLVTWWESLQGRTRVFVAIPCAFVFLFVFHQAFPRLDQGERVLYSLMEAVPIALVVAWATENEMRRRRELEEASRDVGDAPGDSSD